jgi:hypothetical protein
MDMQPIEEPPQSKGYIIAVVICIVVGVLYYWLSPYFYMLMEYIDTIRSLIDLMLSFTANVGESVVDETAEGSKAVVKAVSRPPKEKKPPAPDESSSTMQSTTASSSTSGQYCYVGEWKGIRSCAKVGKSPCKGQTYSTEELCVNPNLRP